MRAGLVLVLVAVAIDHANAEPPRCAARGEPIFEVDQRADPKLKLVTAMTRLWDTGMWKTDVIDTDGTKSHSESGCLDSSRIDRIRAELRTPWKVLHGTAVCSSTSPRFTVYKANGRTVFTERACSGDSLGHDSQAALDRIEVYLRIPDDLDGASLDCRANPLRSGCQ